MTTTQPTEFYNSEGRYLNFYPDRLAINTRGVGLLPFVFDSPEQAQRAALATLTGPGKASESSLGQLGSAVRELRRHVEHIDARAAAEAEAAELEAEAEQLFAAYIKARGWGAAWSIQNEETREAYRALAREARRLHTNKETRP